MAYAFKRGLTQVLYQYMPGSIFSHDDHGLCQVTHVSMQETTVNHEALFSALHDLLRRWNDKTLRSAFPDTADLHERKLFSIGEPREVRFKPFPLILKCVKCNRVYRYEDLRRKPGTRCPECKGNLSQLPYILAHNCGRIEQLYYPTQGCPTHGRKYIKFYDPGRAQLARWQCGICGQEIQRLRMTPCRCEFSKSGGEKWRSFLRLYRSTDPAVHFSHTVTFVNFDQKQEGDLRSSPEAFSLLLARAWDVLDVPVREVAHDLAEITEEKKSGTNVAMEALIKELKRLDPTNELLAKLERKERSSEDSKPSDRVKELLGDHSVMLDVPVPRKLLEHVIILDELTTSSPEDFVAQRSQGGKDRGVELQEAAGMAKDTLGFHRLHLIDDFPIAISAVGYSRVSRKPDTASIVPFPSDESGRLPLFVVPSDTESIMFQLSPNRVLRWLVLNDLLKGPVPSDISSAWAAVFAAMPSLLLGEDAGKGESNDPSRLIYTLLHSISHVLLRGVEWSGFSPASIGEYLLPGTLSGILYLSRYEETKLGGLATLFEEHLLPWLTQALQEGRECTYDPVCTDEGGSCIGCLHREYNCPDFNEWLSRSVLYGGPLDANPESGTDYITTGYWDMPEEVGM